MNKSPEVTKIICKGDLDEKTTVPTDLNLAELNELIIDFGQIDCITSLGIKLWVEFVKTLEGHENLTVNYQRCGRLVIDQLVQTVGFLPKNGKVTSTITPIYCNKCDQTLEHLIEGELPEDCNEIIESMPRPYCLKYPICKNQWEVDLVESSYDRLKKLVS